MTGDNLPGDHNGPPPDDALQAAVDVLKATRGKPLIERIKALGMDPLTDLAGGDWRNCNFSKADLTDCDFRNSRLYFADFKHALVDGADFRGAGDVHTAKIHLAYNWRDAQFDDYQIVLIEGQLAKMRAYLDDQEELHRDTMTEKDWFFAVKNCPSFAEAKAVLAEMEKAGFPLSPYAYSYILDRAKREHKRDQGWALYTDYLARGGITDEAFYTAAMGVSPDSDHALRIFQAMQVTMSETGEVPGERAYNMAISEQDDNFTVALGLFHDMKRKNVKVSRFTIHALFDACQSFANTVTVFMEAARAGVPLGDDEFLIELRNATSSPAVTGQQIAEYKAREMSTRQIIIQLIGDSLPESSFRSDALAALNATPTPPPSSARR